MGIKYKIIKEILVAVGVIKMYIKGGCAVSVVFILKFACIYDEFG